MASSSPIAVYVLFGSSLAPRVRDRVRELLELAAPGRIKDFDQASPPTRESGAWVISIGDTPVTRRSLKKSEVTDLGSEGFIVKTETENGVTYIIADGAAALNERTSMSGNRGVSFAAYELLQQIGFRFFHPFAPKIPQTLRVAPGILISEKPHWPIRGFHLHTMHPIELTHVLNAWGPNGPHDEAGWLGLISEWELYLEWSLAHRQNTVQWALLADKIEIEFNDSTLRQERLRDLVERAHSYGILVGIDVGVVLEQQNTWRIIRELGDSHHEKKQIRERVGWLMQTGIDYLAAEMGFSEFHAPNDKKMLDWINAVTFEVEENFNRPCFMKIHVSQGQVAKDYQDPETKQPINFNFLPLHADPRLTVMPHTVELYSLDDPAPTYGNKNFSEMHRFLSMSAGSRPVVWYPEVGYWVSYDIDVPLFLPLYAERRFHDLRILAREETSGQLGRGAYRGSKIQGQIVFSSGFEWGYWLNHIVAAHSAWNPRLDIEDENEAWEATLTQALRADTTELKKLIHLVSETVKIQNDLLIRGRVNGREPRQIERLTGIAYLSGQDTWGEMNAFLKDVARVGHAETSPSRVAMTRFRKKQIAHGIHFENELRPLLQEMKSKFQSLATAFQALASSDVANDGVLREFADGAEINALRATQVAALYDVCAQATLRQSSSWSQEQLDQAQKALNQATDVVTRREREYRADLNRIAGWGRNPTTYRYGYLWTARRLFYWWRDEGRVTQNVGIGFLNIIDPIEVAFANGKKSKIGNLARRLLNVSPLGGVKECLNPALTEPELRQRIRRSPAKN